MVAAAKTGKFKGFAAFFVCGCIGGLAAGASIPVNAASGVDGYFVFAFQLLAGLALGALTSVPYTLLQNAVNTQRRGWLSWAMAAAFWIALRCGLVWMLF